LPARDFLQPSNGCQQRLNFKIVGNLHALAQHNRGRAVFLSGQFHRTFHLSRIEVVTGDHKMYMNLGKYLGHLICTFGFNFGHTIKNRLTCFFKIATTSNDVQPPMPINSISIGRMPMLRPPFSGAPSMTTAWPVSDSPTKLTPSIHFTLTCIVYNSLEYSIVIRLGYLTASSSTSNIRFAFGGIAPPAPRAP